MEERRERERQEEEESKESIVERRGEREHKRA